MTNDEMRRAGDGSIGHSAFVIPSALIIGHSLFFA